MAPTIKLSTKPTLTSSININSGLASKSNACQNSADVDTTNPANQLDSAFDSNGKKTNIIITYSNSEKY